MLFESFKELIEHVFFSLLAASNIWMHCCIEAIFEIFNINNSVSISVKGLESKIHQRLAAVIHHTYNLTKEFVIVNGARAVTIKQSEDSANLWGISREDTIVLHGLTELCK